MVFDGKKFVEDKEKFLQQEFKKLVKKGDVLKLVSEFFDNQQNKPYKELAKLLNENLNKFYQIN